MHSIEGITANDVWSAARSLLTQPGAASLVEGRGGPTHEVLHVVCKIQQPRERWSVARVPPMNPAFAIAELVWIITGRDDSAFLNRWNSKLPAFAGTGPAYDGAYGARLRRHFGIDQIRRVCDALSADSGSRQAVLQIWDPIQDLPYPNGRPASPDVPCNICSLLKVRDGRLEWTQVMRSNDLFLGLPYNFIQFTYLQEILAGCLRTSVGEYCHFADSLHIYERDIVHSNQVSMIIPSSNTDSLNAPLDESDRYFAEMAAGIEAMSRGGSDNVYKTAMALQLPAAYRNLVLVVAAEAARRKRVRGDVERCLDACTNPCLKQVYRLWDSSRNSRPEPAADSPID
jgi:thymidylate synthase